MKKHIRVFRVVRDPHFKSLVAVNQSEFDKERKKSWRFDGQPPSTKWVELKMRPSDDDLKSPDIWQVIPGVFALEKSAYYELSSSVEETQQGNMRFLKCEKRKLAVINSTHCIDCLDKEKAKFDANNSSRITKYAFHGDQLAVSLFKIPQTSTTELLALDGFDDENDFKTLVEHFGFTGVQFVLLWEGNSFMDV